MSTLYDWTNNPPLLDAAASVAVSLNRNLVAQTKDSIKIFSTDVLTSGEAHSDTRVSHIYPLGENYIICIIRPTRRVTILESETLRELRRDDETLPFWSLPVETDFVPDPEPDFSRPLNGVFDIPTAMRTWWLDTSLDERDEFPDEDTPRPVYGLSPAYTTIAAVYIPSMGYLWVNDTKHGDLIAKLPLGNCQLWGRGGL
jgi:hypothetical protein